MIKNVRLAFHNAIATITPTIETAYEGVTFTPTNGVPYQELYILPALNDPLFIDNPSYNDIGICQILLYYPFGVGTNPIMGRAQLIVDAFKVGSKITYSTDTITITDAPDVRNLDKSGDRLVFAVSINYKCLNQ